MHNLSATNKVQDGETHFATKQGKSAEARGQLSENARKLFDLAMESAEFRSCTALETAQGQILSQSPTYATSGR